MISVSPTTFVLSYLAIINAVTFFSFSFDKYRSRSGGQRTSEKTLLTLALIGGSVGALMAMSRFHHKTKKMIFQAWLAIILATQVLAVFYVFQ